MKLSPKTIIALQSVSQGFNWEPWKEDDFLWVKAEGFGGFLQHPELGRMFVPEDSEVWKLLEADRRGPAPLPSN